MILIKILFKVFFVPVALIVLVVFMLIIFREPK